MSPLRRTLKAIKCRQHQKLGFQLSESYGLYRLPSPAIDIPSIRARIISENLPQQNPCLTYQTTSEASKDQEPQARNLRFIQRAFCANDTYDVERHPEKHRVRFKQVDVSGYQHSTRRAVPSNKQTFGIFMRLSNA